MDSLDNLDPELSALSYDHDVAYEDQHPTPPSNDSGRAALANRIGTSKVYLLSESSTARVGKRKHADEVEDETLGDGVNDDEMDEDLTHRGNAILLQGTPISHLPTARLFAYATHFDTHPLGLEWINDNTCVFVFETKAGARTGQRFLQKSPAEKPDEDDFVTAKPIPIALWPPEERINKSLGKGEGLKGVIRMRWAREGDVKKRGAKKDSEFYKKHGSHAGKELYDGREGPGANKRRRRNPEEDKALLDQDLDEFLAEDEPDTAASPPSKMYSDYISSDGRTLLDRTDSIREYPESGILAGRLTEQRSQRSRNGRPHDRERRRRRGGRGSERRRGEERPNKSQQQLDDELDAFLKEGE
ncbi:uncharacterized protein BT62DRAFT_920124 [Guyanagaster necrorhizus]|uniref:Chromatin target of PRMT1 protein C-terminal domain-containing protein n=1 Tax=Guyanagaster necrorhizus TaxID=856835 RepID=A0A9P7VUG7_9AGAR|nr:uncharacterized protein BT62DRAFT_920124 [Guyanagaster necrorhizus MCA 3950]KAG7446081.1 hypothetical protein BT62DRAFT_920124 [Guyanagaster necrorhizus MCA 3950]